MNTSDVKNTLLPVEEIPAAACHLHIALVLLLGITTLLMGCGSSRPVEDTLEPEPSLTVIAGPSATPSPPASPATPDQQPAEDLDLTWGIPIGAAYELNSVCADGFTLAQMAMDSELNQDTITLGLVMLEDQLSAVASGLADSQNKDFQADIYDSLVELREQFDGALLGWLHGEVPASAALWILQERCPAVATLSGNLEHLARDQGVPVEFLEGYRQSYESMPSIFEFLE
jgi:hypothetical protein